MASRTALAKIASRSCERYAGADASGKASRSCWKTHGGAVGFAIGIGQTHAIPSVQDERDHRALIETLTQQVVPLYYQRDASGLPREWIARQKNAFRTLAWRFNADRMVMDYVQNSYLPAAGGLSCSMRRS